MGKTEYQLIDGLADGCLLSAEDYRTLLASPSPKVVAYAAAAANQLRLRHFGNGIYIRGLIEFTNYCKNNCLYCGIRRDNSRVERYRLSLEQILDCCQAGHQLGFRTFVLQGGEDAFYSDDRIIEIVRAIKTHHPDCAVTLSIGEKSRASYQAFFDVGADRYLLRQETADAENFAKLHPPQQTLATRLQCLRDLQDIGYQVGCGFMVGSPFQTLDCIVKDLLFMRDFHPQMVGIGPFIPHQDTPFHDQPQGSLELTVYLLALIRLTLPKVLLPATTALATIAPDGRQRGILAGANVIMPNLSPVEVRQKYLLYNHKAMTGSEAAEGLELLRRQMADIGCKLLVDRGDAPSNP